MTHNVWNRAEIMCKNSHLIYGARNFSDPVNGTSGMSRPAHYPAHGMVQKINLNISGGIL